MTDTNWGILEKIKVENFKSIKKMDLSLKPLNIIVGPNGVGKSNFIGVFDLLYNIGEKQLQRYTSVNGGADRFLHFGSKVSNNISIKLAFPINTYECRLLYATGNKFVFDKEEGCVTGGGYHSKCDIFTETGAEESKFQYLNSDSIGGYIKDYLNGLRKYHFHDTTKESPLKQSSKKNDCGRLRGDGSNLAAMLYRFKERDVYQSYYNKIVEIIRMVAPFFEDFILEPDENDNITLVWKHKDSDKYFDAFDLSDGTLRFIALTTLLSQPDILMPQTIIIDEPELGLHPYALKVLAEQMKSVALRGKQIVATSQSVTFINEFSYEDIVVADRKDEQSVFRRLEENEVKNWLDEFAMGDIWEKNIIGGTPNEF